MDTSNSPSKIQVPFANATTYKYTIPVASQTGTDVRKASYEDGFPPLTMEPISSGGVAPYGQDFNGVLNQLSAGLRWEQSNTPFKFDSDFCTAIGGYPLGAKLLSADNAHYWINQVADNTVNPDTVGTNWVAGESISTGYYPKSTIADKWTTPSTLTFTGDVTGGGSVDGSGDVSFAMTGIQAAKWTTARTLTYTGFATGSGSVDGSGNVSIALSMGSGFTSSKTTNGYTYLPNGLILQWGWAAAVEDVVYTVTLPITFPTAILNVSATARSPNTGATGATDLAAHADINNTSSILITITSSSGSYPGTNGAFWFAVGY